jgi:uncharacterized membrane protein YfcA
MPPLDWPLLALCVTAFLAGAMNSIAGGGTLLTFPALTSVISAAAANGTSTVALMPGSFAGTLGYRKELWECRKFALRMLVPSLLGGFLGAWLVGRDQKAFADLVPWLILTAAVLFVLQGPISKWLKARAAGAGVQPEEHKPSVFTQTLVIGFQFLVAVYGGYFGAGIGILMLSALGFMGIGDIHRMNAVKTFLATAINGMAAIVFIFVYRPTDEEKQLVHWGYAIPMAVTSILGGYVGARVSLRLKPVYVRYAVIVIGFGLSVFYFIRHYG